MLNSEISLTGLKFNQCFNAVNFVINKKGEKESENKN